MISQSRSVQTLPATLHGINNCWALMGNITMPSRTKMQHHRELRENSFVLIAFNTSSQQ